MRLFLDLETLPDLSEGAKDRVRATLKPPANYSKPETIEKWKDENAEDAWRKTSFDGGYGSICVIGYAINDAPPVTIIADENESGTLDLFWMAASEAMRARNEPVEWIGHNLLGFDLPFLWKRVVIHGLNWRNFIPKDARHGTGKAFCTMQAWAGYRDRISLDALAKILGLASHKDNFDGSMVYDAWQAGERQKVADYCKADVELTREIFRRIS